MKLLYKPFGIVFGVLGGLLASKVFLLVWKRTAGDVTTPDPKDQQRGWGEVATAAALQGAVYGLVKALVDRAGATGYARATGTWPGRTAPVDEPAR